MKQPSGKLATCAPAAGLQRSAVVSRLAPIAERHADFAQANLGASNAAVHRGPSCAASDAGMAGSRSSGINSDSATQAFPTETHYALRLSEPLGNLIARCSNDNRD
jgi:hypothetical protein